MNENEYIKKEEYDRVQEEKEALERKVKKLEKRLDSIVKINDNTFKTIFNKNTSLEKNVYRFDRILQQSDRQGKSILIQKEEQERLLFAQAKMALMGEMIDNIAHQWRQPLNNISAMVQTVALKFMQNKVDTTMMENFKTDTIKQILYMSNTVDDFRGFLKEDKKVKLFNLVDTCKKVKVLTKTVIASNDIIFEINGIENIHINGIENELIQVIMNLISNSIEAYRDVSNKKIIIIDIAVDHKDVLICFKDNAGGVPSPIIKTVFDFRFTTKEQEGGTGIGLYMSKKIIEDTFLGTINVQNETFLYEKQECMGASFLIRLPKSA